MQLQQTVGLLREALRYCLRDAFMVRGGNLQPLRMLKLHPAVGGDALAGAKGQGDETAIAACPVNRLVEGFVGNLIGLNVLRRSVVPAKQPARPLSPPNRS